VPISVAAGRFGIHRETLSHYHAQYLKPLDESSWAERISKIDKETQGKKPLLTDDEIKSLLMYAAGQKQLGDGVSARTFRSFTRDMMLGWAKKAGGEGDTKTEEKYSNVVCSSSWFRKTMKKHHKEVFHCLWRSRSSCSLTAIILTGIQMR